MKELLFYLILFAALLCGCTDTAQPDMERTSYPEIKRHIF